MKVIFLDVDGVLNTNHTTNVRCDGYLFVDDYLVENLSNLIKKSGAKVVLSSDWRYGWNERIFDDAFPNEQSFDDFVDKLQEYDIELMDCTDCLEGDPSRGEEIKTWLNKHPEVTNFVALDDRLDMKEVRNNWVRTFEFEGLTEEKCEQALEILRRD